MKFGVCITGTQLFSYPGMVFSAQNSRKLEMKNVSYLFAFK